MNSIDIELVKFAYKSWQDTFIMWSMMMPRMLVAFSLIPFLNRRLLPNMVRTGVVSSMILVVLPFMLGNIDKVKFSVFLLVKEVFIGFIMGYGIAVVFWAVEAAGGFIDNQRGASIASTVNPMTSSDSVPLGIFLLNLIAWIFFTGGGFLSMLMIFLISYKIWPVWEFFPLIQDSMLPMFIGMLDSLMYMGLVLATPILLAMFFSELGLALTNRFAPQLQVFFLSMPIKSGVAFFILILYLSFFAGYAMDVLKHIATFMERLEFYWAIEF